MNKSQENYLSMCVALSGTCDKFNSVWTTSGAFVASYTDFKSNVALLQETARLQLTEITGYAVDKADKKIDMIKNTMIVINGMKAYAIVKNNSVLLNEINYSKSDLENTRDELVAEKCQLINERALVLVAELAEYNLSNAQITLQQNSIASYKAISQMPSEKKDAKQYLTAKVEQTITLIREKLVVLDSLANTFKESNPDFVSEYFNSREIYDLGTRHENDEEG